MKNTKLLWITRTAIFLALLIAIQFVTRGMDQLIIGSLVNLVLLVATLTAGLTSGLTVAMISPFLATWLGISKLPFTGPYLYIALGIVAIGNIIIVLLASLFVEGLAKGKFGGKHSFFWIAGIIAGAIAKALVLWIGMTKIMALIVPGMKAPILAKLMVAFSWKQLVTGLIGGTIAIIIAPKIRKAIHK